MAIKKALAVATTVLLVGIGNAQAEEQSGVKVYSGATLDEANTKALRQAMPGTKVSCYTTRDPADKVTNFYKQQGLRHMGGDKENAMFQKGNMDVTIQNPWMDLKTGTLVNSTLICFVRRAQ